MPRKLSTSRPLEPTAFALSDAKVWSALRKPFRWRLFEAVRACGGISAQDLARRVGITSQLMLYHLQLLERAGLLTHDAGKRSRGKGGKFRARTDRIDLTIRGDAAIDRRRIDAIMAAFQAETRTDGAPDTGAGSAVRWERLTPIEAKRIARAHAEIEAILDEAATRRGGDTALPDATHAICSSMQRIATVTMPSPAWSCRTVRGRRSGGR
jgi:predicted ArsR family transcriptional regulator